MGLGGCHRQRHEWVSPSLGLSLKASYLTVNLTTVANAKDVLSVGEDGWREAVLPLSYGIEPVRGWGFNDLRRPENLAPEAVWDWAGVEGLWCGSYAFLEWVY